MTDIAGTGEPAGTDRASLDPVVPVVPIGPGASGVAAPAVVAGADPLGEMPLDAEPLADTAEPHSHDHDHHDDGGHHHGHDHHHGHHGDGHSHEPEHRGMLDGITDAVRGLFGRVDKGQ
jgi:hypothetical protein